MKRETVKNVDGGFWLKREQIVVDHAKNVRIEGHVASGDETPGSEQASVSALAGTLRRGRVGQLQPCLVRRRSDFVVVRGEKLQKYDLIFGHRRFEASATADVAEVFCTEWIGPKDADLDEVRAVENLARKKLSAPEVLAVVRSMDARKPRPRPEEIAARLSIGVDAATMYLQVARRLHREIQAAWRRTPGAFQLAELARVATLGDEKQLEWFRGNAARRISEKLGAALPKRKRARARPRADLEVRREEVRAKKLFAIRSPDFRLGYVEALSWAMGERS